jgi:hypothetical protein
MSQPLSSQSFLVHPEAVEALAAELGSLAAELTDDARWTRSTATSFPVALGGGEGWVAGSAATAWACLQEVLAAQADAVAGTLIAAAAAYRAEDAALSGRVAAGRPADARGPR